jgi:hypothetical protein
MEEIIVNYNRFFMYFDDKKIRVYKDENGYYVKINLSKFNKEAYDKEIAIYIKHLNIEYLNRLGITKIELFYGKDIVND